MNIQIKKHYRYTASGKKIISSEYQCTEPSLDNQHGWYKRYDELGNLIYFDFMYHGQYVGIEWDWFGLFNQEHTINFYLL